MKAINKIFLFSILFNISCNKSSDTIQPNLSSSDLRNKYLLSQIEEGTMVIKFSYKGDKCAKIEQYESNKLDYSYDLYYNSIGKCIRIIDGTKNGIVPVYWEFEYNSKNQLVKIIETSQSFNSKNQTPSELEYYADGMLKKVTTIYSPTFVRTKTYDWNKEGNVTRASEYDWYGRLETSGEFRYDTKTNLAKIQSIPYGFQGATNMSENNINGGIKTEGNSPPENFTAENTYDDEGKLIKSEFKSNGKFLGSLKYTYILR